MLKKFFSIALCSIMLTGLVGCAGTEPTSSTEPAQQETPAETATEAPAEEEEAPEETAEDSNYKIGIITGTVSQGEEEYRAAENMKAKYGDMIVTATYPDNFTKEQETVISQVQALAADEDVKAIVFVQSIPGASAAIDKVRERRPDMLFVSGVAAEAPDVIASKADVVLNANEIAMGSAIAHQAKAMGAETVVHYSFPRHMSYETLSMRRDLLKETCEELGLEYVEATCPDPTGDSGVPGAQQFILEDVPRKVAEYGPNTAFFNTNCSMQEPLIKAVIDEGAILVQQCCPSPYHAYPGALGIAVPEDKQGDIDYIVAEIEKEIADRGATGRLGTWPVPVNMLLIEAGVEYSIQYLEGNTNGTNDPEVLAQVFEDILGAPADLSTYEELDNFYLLLSDYIVF